ncbi:MAG: cysteine desulfurase [Cytophagales bacterium]|nr:cysteine desulfurase [Armatimonadota bacterium]
MPPKTIYLDYAATTPTDPLVFDAMLPYLGGDGFGNPSSVHQAGQRVRRAIDQARDTLASEIGAEASEIYFTSGGTEADNTAILGVLLAARMETGRDHLVTLVTEHHAVLDCAQFAEKTLGFRVTYLPVDREGFVPLESVAEAITDRTALVSVMHGNNEIGTLQPVAGIARLAHERGAYFHTDAVQTFGQMPLAVAALDADLVTLSAHKIYGPKGAGALFVRQGVRWTPWLHGGQQEREKRAGTENAAAIVGFGKAVELLPTWRDSEALRLARLRDDFIAQVLAAVPGAGLNGPAGLRRLPNSTNLSFPGTDSESLLLGLDLAGIAASAGSACASGSIEPSHVLLALGMPSGLVRSALRFSLGRGTTSEQLDRVTTVLRRLVSSDGPVRV